MAVPTGLDNDDARRELVAGIHATSTMLVLAVTGGGAAVVTDLLVVPGASRTVLEVIVPYAEAALLDLIGSLDAGWVSQSAAQAMALTCLTRARHLAPDHEQLIGVACTAALVTDRPKKGSHRAHLAVARLTAPRGSPTASVVEHEPVELGRSGRDREAEDRVVADALLTMIARACGRSFG